MNLFQAVYCNQYAELKKSGRDASKARMNGTILITAMIIVNLFTLILLMNTFGKLTNEFKSVEELFQFTSGRSAGRLIGLVLFIVIGFFTYKLIGSPGYFNKTINRFESLEETKQKRIEKRGLVYVFLSIGIFTIVLIMGLF